MTDLHERKCVPCEGGVPALDAAQRGSLKAGLHPDWAFDAAGKSLKRACQFRDFYRTMSFVNAVAHIANQEDHHPDLEVGYNYCRIKYTTHAIGGLTENDFICAAKIDRL